MQGVVAQFFSLSNYIKIAMQHIAKQSEQYIQPTPLKTISVPIRS